ncbi:DMT family transporter [Microvirga sp. TS319]|uniref:DMT family transporter n=1 Tax=Microvirga sp. TS319 TaxID=3241165 RepID=UPI00351A1A69
MVVHSKMQAAGRWLYGQPYLLLVVTTLFWGGNVVAGKLAIGEVSPMAVTFLRWLLSATILGVFARPAIAAEWRQLVPAWRYILIIGFIGFTGFNALFFTAAYYTSAVNIAIIQGSTPIMVLIGTLFLGASLRMLQGLGVLATIAGVVITASHGDWHVLSQLTFNRGDTWLLIASIFYAGYTLALRRRPRTSALVFFVALSTAACLTSVPLLVVESMMGQLKWPTAWGWLILLYVVLLPSLLCQIFYIRGIELIGPARAGTFYNLVPIFGAVLSTLILDEPFAAYHVVALALVLGGIGLAEHSRAGASAEAPISQDRATGDPV